MKNKLVVVVVAMIAAVAGPIIIDAINRTKPSQRAIQDEEDAIFYGLGAGAVAVTIVAGPGLIGRIVRLFRR